MFSNKWIILAVIVVVALVVWNLFDFRGGEQATPTPMAGGISSPTPQSPSGGSGGSSGSGAGQGSGSGQGSVFTQTQVQNYSQLVNEYEGRRIQFDESCQINPNTVTFKKGTTVMFDNRSNTTKTLIIAGQTQVFPPYGYKLLTLNSQMVPITLTISCDNRPNIGSILLQANILGE